MKKSLTLYLFLVVALNTICQSISSDLVSSSGVYKDTLGISLAWSVGEPVSESFTRNENALTQGFHNGKYMVTTLSKDPDLDYDIKVFPNPARDLFNILFADIADVSGKQFSLYDLKGNLLKTGPIRQTLETIDFSPYPPAIYLLHITENDKKIQSFKVQKEN